MRKFFRNLFLGVRANASNISLIIIVLGFLGMFGLIAVGQEKQSEQLNNEQQILTQLQGVTSRLATGAETRTQQFNELNQHMDCIVEFFAQPDHAQKSISDINTCELINNKTGATVSPPKSDTNTNTTPQSTNTGVVSQPENQSTPKTPKPSIIDSITNFLKGL